MELQHFTLRYIGLCAAIGQPVQIPFVIAFLAQELIQFEEREAGIIITTELLDLLDAGPLCAVPKSHLHAWWLGDAAPKDDEMMTSETIADIMEAYYEDDDKFMPFGHSQHSCPPASNLADEGQYGLLAVPHRVRQQVLHAESAIRKSMILSQRRASGFYQLWEAALHKESETYTFAASAAAGSTQETAVPVTAGIGQVSTTSAVIASPQAIEVRPYLHQRTKEKQAANCDVRQRANPHRQRFQRG